MAEKTNPSSAGDAWYTEPGSCQNVVYSTRVVLSRNLANFPFPQKMSGPDGERIQAIIFDAFNHIPDSENYQAIAVSKLDPLGARILTERQMLESTDQRDSGVAMRVDGKVSCSVNIGDHVRIRSFVSGFDPDKAVALCRDLDDKLQTKVQFAASYDFGYLTSSILDAGSGMKISFFLHLPAIAAMGKIPEISKMCSEKGLVFRATYGTASGTENLLNQNGVSLGCAYTLEQKNSFTGNEYDQVVNISSVCRTIIENEKSLYDACSKKYISTIQNEVYRAFALTRFSKFVTYREGLQFVHYLKWGTSLGYVKGVKDYVFHALLFRIQDAHLEYVLNSGNFNFEQDIADNVERKVCRLRALILQEAFEDLAISE